MKPFLRTRVFIGHYRIARRCCGPLRSLWIAQAFTALLPQRAAITTWSVALVIAILIAAAPGWMS